MSVWLCATDGLGALMDMFLILPMLALLTVLIELSAIFGEYLRNESEMTIDMGPYIYMYMRETRHSYASQHNPSIRSALHDTPVLGISQIP
jgi:hypothetical protein